jgi:hypothetical protein
MNKCQRRRRKRRRGRREKQQGRTKKNEGAKRKKKGPRKLTSPLKEPRNPIKLIPRQSRQYLTSNLHIPPQHRSLIFNNGERKRVAVDVEVFVCEVDPVVCWDVAQEVKWAREKVVSVRKEGGGRRRGEET